MTRYSYAGGAADFVFDVAPSGYLRLRPAALLVWADETGGARVTDLQINGDPVTAIPVDDSGQVPAFEGPDGFEGDLWAATAPDRPRIRLTSNAGVQRADAAADRAEAAAAQAAEISGLSTVTEALAAADADPETPFRQQQDARLSATIAAGKEANSVVILGTSITEQNSIRGTPDDTWPTDAGVYRNRRAGYWTWASVRLGHRWKLLRNAGIYGSNLQSIRERIPTQVAPYSPAWVIVEGGAGDMGSTSAAIIATLQGIYDDLRALGSRVVATTIMPCAYADTPAKVEMLHNVNTWIRNYATTTPGMVLCDWHAALADPATGAMLGGYSQGGDGVHPNAHGAALLGKVLADALAPVAPGTPALPASNLDASVLTPNPMMVGTAGNIGAATGTAPNSWTITTPGTLGTVAVSKVSRVLAGLPFEWTQLHRTSAGEVWMMTTDSTPPVGATVHGVCEFETDADFGNPSGLATPTELALYVFAEGTSTVASDLAGDAISESTLIPRSGVLRTPDFVVPSGCTALTICIAFGATNGKLRVARAGVRYSS